MEKPLVEIECKKCQDTREVNGMGCPKCCSHTHRDKHNCCLDCGEERSELDDADYLRDLAEDR